MNEKPILFSAPMVRAILAGTKTQTRRQLYVLRKMSETSCLDRRYPPPRGLPPVGAFWTLSDWRNTKPGDRLWVRESGWERPYRTRKMMREGADTWAPYAYDADAPFGIGAANDAYKEWGWKRRPSIHMPRWASRITLEVIEARVQLLQDISAEDAVAEGCRADEGMHGDDDMAVYTTQVELDRRSGKFMHTPTPVSRFIVMWESINPGTWDMNPWVVVVKFRRIET